jgi:hypothetical protein
MLIPESQEAQVKLSEVMKCNKSVGSFYIRLERHLVRGEIHNERIQLFATLATSGWSSIQYLEIVDKFDCISLRGSAYMSNFILQSENFRDLRLQIAGDETMGQLWNHYFAQRYNSWIQFFLRTSLYRIVESNGCLAVKPKIPKMSYAEAARVRRRENTG